jgi:hypothetical protein
MKLNYNPEKDITMTFKMSKYPKILNEEKLFVSHAKRANTFAVYIEEQTGIRVDAKTFRDNDKGVSIDATISNVMSKRKVLDYLVANEEKIQNNDIILEEGIVCNYCVKNEVYSPSLLKEDIEYILEEKVQSIINETEIEVSESTVLEGFENDMDAVFIVEHNGDYIVESFNADVEEIYEDSDAVIDEDDFDDKVEERVVRKRLIRGGKSIFKRKATRTGYKFSGGREVRMSSKELRDRKLAQIKAARKRQSKMRTLQKSRKRSLSMRTRRLG